jgi:hypothetical protein
MLKPPGPRCTADLKLPYVGASDDDRSSRLVPHDPRNGCGTLPRRDAKVRPIAPEIKQK